MSSLYELTEIMRTVLDGGVVFDEETGEVLFDSDSIDALDVELDEKLDNCAAYVKNLEADAKAIKAECDALTRRRKAAEAKAARMRSYIADCMQASGMRKFSSPRSAMSIRHSSRVDVVDEKALPKEFVRKVSEVVVDKQAILKALRSGEEVEGARLEETTSLQVR